MNTFAIVMQSSAMSSAQQWMVIGLTLAISMGVLALSGPVSMPAWKVRVLGGVGVALLLAVLASAADAAIYMECSWWGCWLDTIFW